MPLILRRSHKRQHLWRLMLANNRKIHFRYHLKAFALDIQYHCLQCSIYCIRIMKSRRKGEKKNSRHVNILSLYQSADNSIFD